MGNQDAVHGDNRDDGPDSGGGKTVSRRSGAGGSRRPELAGPVYRVLIPCRDDATGKAYQPGDKVTAEDFTERVIANWLRLEPPVLEEIDDGS